MLSIFAFQCGDLHNLRHMKNTQASRMNALCYYWKLSHYWVCFFFFPQQKRGSTWLLLAPHSILGITGKAENQVIPASKTHFDRWVKIHFQKFSNRVWQDSYFCKDTCHWAWWSEFDSWDAHNMKVRGLPQVVLWLFICAVAWAHTDP